MTQEDDGTADTEQPATSSTMDSAAAAVVARLQLGTADPLAAIAAAVAMLPGLPPSDPAQPYGAHRLTTSWLNAAYHRSPHTAKAYFRDLNRFLTWCVGRHLDPLHLKPVDLTDYGAGLTRHLAPSSAARALAGAAAWYQFLLANGAVDANPLAAVPRPQVDQDSTTAGLTEAEVDALLDAADAVVAERTAAQARVPSPRRARRLLAALRDRALLRLIADLGVRIGEGLALDIAALSTQYGHRTVRYVGKGRKVRERPLGPHVVEALDEYLAARAAFAGASVDAQSGPLFATLTDDGQAGRLDEPAVFRTVRRLARYAGIASSGRLSPHSLRHAFATAADEAGVPLEHVQDAMGHADPRTTRRYNRRRHILENDPGLQLGARRAARRTARRHIAGQAGDSNQEQNGPRTQDGAAA